MQLIGLSCAVPKNEVSVLDLAEQFGRETVEKIVSSTGIRKRRIAPRGMFASDLSVVAAEELLRETNIDRKTIDALIFVTQTPDYLIPTTSSLIQHRLGLPTTALTIDMNKGCTGFTDGLITAQAFLAGLGMKRVMLMVSDTPSKYINPKDQSSALLFGDAATVALLEPSDEPFMSVFGSDGSGFEAIHVKAGLRLWDDPASFPMNFESLATHLDGALIFEFTIKRIPPLVRELLERTGWTVETTDAFIFHQANQFILNHLARKLRIPSEKFPVSLANFGNTAGPSIPVTLVTEMRETLKKPQNLVFVGFGIGLAWSAAAWNWHGTETVCPLIEVS